MIRLKTKCKTVQKQHKNSFIPFQNERDNLGRIIRPKINKKNDYNIMQLFENLKKSTKEYFFDKQFQKMQRKFANVKRSLGDRQYDYERQVNFCVNIINKMMENKAEGQQNKQNLYINLRQKINNKISGVTSCLKKAKHKRQRCDQNFDQSPQKQTQQMYSKTVNQIKNMSKSQYILKQLERQPRKINIELFKSLSSRSEMMATFCENGLKYSKFVHQKSFNPWKKWYRTNQFQIFPGKVVEVRCLQKSIYQ